jgi:hypothetical protein
VGIRRETRWRTTSSRLETWNFQSRAAILSTRLLLMTLVAAKHTGCHRISRTIPSSASIHARPELLCRAASQTSLSLTNAWRLVCQAAVAKETISQVMKSRPICRSFLPHQKRTTALCGLFPRRHDSYLWPKRHSFACREANC